MWDPQQFNLSPNALGTRIIVGTGDQNTARSTVISNTSAVNEVYLGPDSSVSPTSTTIAIIPPGGNAIVDGVDDIYAMAFSGATVQVAPGVLNYQPGTLL